VFTRGKVEIGDNYYQPLEITVVVGGTATWQIATGENQHDVVSTDNLFRSNSPMNRGVDMFTFTFTKPGVYTYICSTTSPSKWSARSSSSNQLDHPSASESFLVIRVGSQIGLQQNQVVVVSTERRSSDYRLDVFALGPSPRNAEFPRICWGERIRTSDWPIQNQPGLF
jgi:hypothetical protein